MKFKKIVLIIILVISFIYMVIRYKNNTTEVLQSVISKECLDEMEIIVGGEAVGIKLLATGVLVMEVDRYDTNLKIGDIILEVNDNKIETNKELLEFAKISKGKPLNLKVDRKNKISNIKILPVLDKITNEYKLGLWVKDSSAGVGTITFYDKKNMEFAALGHGITESKENCVLPIESGGITKTTIYGIEKGYPRNPGQINGSITKNTIGEIIKNTDKGIYGKIYNEINIPIKKEVEICSKNEIKEDEAYIYCTLDNKVEKFKIKIEQVILESSGNKNMIIKVIDENLIKITGGIIQGMSGSPIIQNDKLIGAVTHVLLNDPTRGYGVFIENMISDLKK